jgi:hypothetical protein
MFKSMKNLLKDLKDKGYVLKMFECEEFENPPDVVRQWRWEHERIQERMSNEIKHLNYEMATSFGAEARKLRKQLSDFLPQKYFDRTDHFILTPEKAIFFLPYLIVNKDQEMMNEIIKALSPDTQS